MRFQEYTNALANLEPQQQAILLSTQGLTNAEIQQTLALRALNPELINQSMSEAGLLKSKQSLTNAQIEENLQTVLGADADINATRSALGLKNITESEAQSVSKLTKRNLEAAIASGKLTQTQAAQLANIWGIDLALNKNASTTLPKWIATLQASAKVIWENVKATATWLVSTPAGWATLAVVAIGAATVALIKHTKSLEDLQEAAKESKSVYDDTINEIQSLNEELSKTKSRIDELQGKESLTILEQNELDKLKATNEELEREIRIKEAIAKSQGKQAADDAETAITKVSEKYNAHVESMDTYSEFGGSFVSYDRGDRIDAANWDIAQAEQNNKELEVLYAKRKEIEDKYNNNVSEFQNDKEWQKNNKDIDSKKSYIKSVEDSAGSYINDLMKEDDGLYDSDGKVIKGKEELVNRLLQLYTKFDEYNSKGNYVDTFISTLQDKGISEASANEIKNQLSDAELKQVAQLDIKPYINENSTIDTVRRAIKKAQEEADKNQVIFTKDPSDLLQESDNKSQTATLADLKSEANLMQNLQKEMQETGTIGVDTMQSIMKQFPEATEALYDYISGVKNSTELFSDLENVYNTDKEQYINSMLEKNQANEDFFASLKAGYPEVFAQIQGFLNQENALFEQNKNNYINSIIEQKDTCEAFLSFIRENYPELYNQLGSVYDNDKENFIRHVFAENEQNQEFIEGLSIIYPELANALGTVYGNDVTNWESIEQAKAQITANLINQLNEVWSQYFDGISETFGAYGTILENADGSGYTYMAHQDDSFDYDHNMLEDEWQASQPAIKAYNNVKEQMNNSIKLVNASIQDLQSSAYEKVKSSVGGLDWRDLTNDTNSSSFDNSNNYDSDNFPSYDNDISDTSNEPTPEDFDWIERAVKKIERTISNLSSIVEDTYSNWSERNNVLLSELSAVSEQISIQEQSAQKYFELADNVGLEEDYQNLIKNGDFNIETITDDGLKERIKNYQDYYDKATEAQDKAKELRKTYNDLNNQRLDHLTSEFDQLNNSNTIAIKYAQNGIDDSHASYYAKDSVIVQQQSNYLNYLAVKQQERQRIIDEFSATGIDINSEAGYKWLTTLQDIDDEIIKLNDDLKNLNDTKFDNLSNEFKNTYQWIEEQNNIWKDKVEDTFTNWTDRNNAVDNLKSTIQQQIAQYNQYRNQVMQLFQEANEDGNSEAAQKYYSEIFSIDSALRTLDQDYNSTTTTVLNNSVSKFEQNYSSIEKTINDTENIMNDSTKSYIERNNALILQTSNIAQAIVEQEEQKAKLERELAQSGIEPNTEEWYNWQEQIKTCDNTIQELQENSRSLNKQKFDNISSQFEEINNIISNSINILEKYIAIAETKGLFIDKSLYTKSIDFYETQLNNQLNERDRLTEAMNKAITDGVDQSSEEFNSMNSQIKNVNATILETTNTIESLKNSIKELDFSKFEYLQDSFSDFSAEGNYYIDLVDKIGKDLYDDKGNVTKEGITTVALHLQNKDIYLNQAKHYSDKIKEIDAELLNASTNKELIEKKKEYVEALRQANLSAMSEKKSVEDLVKNGYQKQLDYIQQIIDKKKEQMDTESDVYEYQKTIAEKTENLSKLYKQRTALTQMNDDSEENVKRLQELKVSIEEAEKDLQETEYEKMKTDRQKQLDNFQNEFSDMMDNMLQNIDENLINIVNEVNSSSTAIISTLKELSKSSGLDLSETIREIYANGSSYANLNIDISAIDQNYSKANQAIVNIETSIKNFITNMEEESKKKQYGIDVDTSLNNKVNEVNTSINNTIGVMTGLNNTIKEASESNLSSLNDSIKALISAMNENTNNYYIDKTPVEYAYTQEDRAIPISAVENGMAFNDAMTENLYNLSKDGFISNISSITTPVATANNNISTPTTISYSIDMGGVTINDVNNPNDFAQQLRSTIANDVKTKKILKASTIDLLSGKSEKEAYKYI